MNDHRFDGPDCGVDGCQREIGHIGPHRSYGIGLPPADPRLMTPSYGMTSEDRVLLIGALAVIVGILLLVKA